MKIKKISGIILVRSDSKRLPNKCFLDLPTKSFGKHMKTSCNEQNDVGKWSGSDFEHIWKAVLLRKPRFRPDWDFLLSEHRRICKQLSFEIDSGRSPSGKSFKMTIGWFHDFGKNSILLLSSLIKSWRFWTFRFVVIICESQNSSHGPIIGQPRGKISNTHRKYPKDNGAQGSEFLVQQTRR